ESRGKVVAIEYDPPRAKEAKANMQKAGLTDVVTVIEGDAFEEIPKLQGTFDLVFLDAWKPDYKRFFDSVYPRIDPGGDLRARTGGRSSTGATSLLRFPRRSVPRTRRRNTSAKSRRSVSTCTSSRWSRSMAARCRSCSEAITASPRDPWRRAPTGCGASR